MCTQQSKIADISSGMGYFGGGYAQEFTGNATTNPGQYEPIGTPKAMIRWSNQNDNYMCFQWKNPAIKTYEILVLNADDSVYINQKEWRYHPMFWYLYTDIAGLNAETNNNADYSFIFPVAYGKTYKWKIIMHGTDGSQEETPMQSFSVPGSTVVIAPAPVAKKGKK